MDTASLNLGQFVIATPQIVNLTGNIEPDLSYDADSLSVLSSAPNVVSVELQSDGTAKCTAVALGQCAIIFNGTVSGTDLLGATVDHMSVTGQGTATVTQGGEGSFAIKVDFGDAQPVT